MSSKPIGATWMHTLGVRLGRALDAWCVRGYGVGTFRNGFAVGFAERLAVAHVCDPRNTPVEPCYPPRRKKMY